MEPDGVFPQFGVAGKNPLLRRGKAKTAGK